MGPHSSILKRAAESVHVDEIDREIDALDTRMDDVQSQSEARIAAIQRERDAELAALRGERETLVGLKVYAVGAGAIGAAVAHGIAETAAVDDSPPDAARPPLRKGVKQAAVLELLDDGEMRSKHAIGHHLIDLGVMTDAKKDWHSLDVLLSRMVAQTKKIARPRPSMYQSLSAASAAGDDNSRLPVEEVEV